MDKIEELRREIDETDEKTVELFLHRLSLSREMGKYKKENSMPVKDEKREAEIIKKLCAGMGDDAQYIKKLYETVFEISRDLQS